MTAKHFATDLEFELVKALAQASGTFRALYTIGAPQNPTFLADLAREAEGRCDAAIRKVFPDFGSEDAA